MFELDYEKEPKPTTRDEKIFLTIFCGLIAMCFAGAILDDYKPVKLSALFFIVAWAPLLFLHELGHALVAKMVGWRVDKFVIGYGRIIKQFQFAGVQCEFRMFPIMGYVQPRALTVKSARLKNGLIYFAGPGIELLLFFIIFLIVGPKNFMAPTDNYLTIALVGVALAAALGAIINLVPMTAITQKGHTPNDGMGILLCFITPRKDYERMIKRSIDQNEHSD